MFCLLAAITGFSICRAASSSENVFVCLKAVIEDTQHKTTARFESSFINKSYHLTNQTEAEDVTINIWGLWLLICEH